MAIDRKQLGTGGFDVSHSRGHFERARVDSLFRSCRYLLQYILPSFSCLQAVCRFVTRLLRDLMLVLWKKPEKRFSMQSTKCRILIFLFDVFSKEPVRSLLSSENSHRKRHCEKQDIFLPSEVQRLMHCNINELSMDQFCF